MELGPFVLVEEGLLDSLLEHRLEHLLVEVNKVPLSLEFRLMAKQKVLIAPDQLARGQQALHLEVLVTERFVHRTSIEASASAPLARSFLLH